ncbi:MAG: hypothetical protein R3C05_19485 [Pirellulaceae bacterium]
MWADFDNPDQAAWPGMQGEMRIDLTESSDDSDASNVSDSPEASNAANNLPANDQLKTRPKTESRSE